MREKAVFMKKILGKNTIFEKKIRCGVWISAFGTV